MAVNNRKITVEDIVDATAKETSKTSANNSTNLGGNMNDFFSGFMKPHAVSEYIRRFREIATEVLKDQTLFNVKILAFDNQSTHSGWAYSFVCIACTRSDTDNVYFMPVLVEATGKEPVSIDSMLETDPRTGLVKVKDPTSLFTPNDYFNNIVIDEIKKAVLANFPGKNAKYVDGEIIPYNADVEKVVPYVTINALSAAYIAYTSDKGIRKDLEISKFAGTQTFADVTLNPGLTINKLNRVTNVDYSIKLVNKKQQNGYQRIVPGLTEESKILSTISGYVEEAIVAETDGFGKTNKKALPVMITTTLDTEYPTLGYSLLALASSAIINQPNIVMNLLYNKPNSGALNFLCNLEKAEAGVGAAVNLHEKKYDYRKAMAYLNKLFIGRVATAVELELNSEEYFKMSPFAALLDPTKWQESNDFIVKTGEKLTGKKFQNRVVFNYAIETPIGEWVDNNGVTRDLREIDLATVISYTKDINIIHSWITSNEDPKVSQIDPYITKLEVYNKLGLNAKVTSKAARIYIDPAWLGELIEGIQANGFNPVLNNNINYTDFADLSNFGTSSIASAMLNTSMGNMPGYGQGYQYQNYGRMSGMFY